MRETRVVLCSVTYDEVMLAITDCDNRELQQICEVVCKNNESGIGRLWSEVCQDIYPDNIFYQLADTGEVNMIYPLNEIDSECVANYEDVAISVVVSKIEDEDESDGSEYAYLDDKWEELEDVLMVENKDGILVLKENWWVFSKGTNQEEIWNYFGSKHPEGLSHFIQ